MSVHYYRVLVLISRPHLHTKKIDGVIVICRCGRINLAMSVDALSQLHTGHDLELEEVTSVTGLHRGYGVSHTMVAGFYRVQGTGAV